MYLSINSIDLSQNISMSNIVNEMIRNSQENTLVKWINKVYWVTNTSEEINNKIADLLLELQNYKNEQIELEANWTDYLLWFNEIQSETTSQRSLEKELIDRLWMTSCKFYWWKNGIVWIDASKDIYSFSKKIYRFADDQKDIYNANWVINNEVDTATEIKVLNNWLVAASHYRWGWNDPVKNFEYTVYQKNWNPLAISYEEYISL